MAQVSDGSLIDHLPKFTVVQLQKECIKDHETDNLRRLAKIEAIPGVLNENIPEEKKMGYITVFDSAPAAG
jgi:hypothetical protein